MPCYHPVVKKVFKPENPYYPKKLTALGDHIRQKRMEFLGYCPWEHIQAWGERLNRYRIHQGLSMAQFARQLEVDPGTLARQLKKNPSAYFKKKVAELMNRWGSSD